MPQFAGCVVLEWGWGFLALFAAAIIAIAIILAFVVWFFMLRKNPTRQNRESVVIEKLGLKATGPRVITLIAFLGAIVGIGWVVHLGYEKFRHSYAVALDSPTVEITLENVKDKFQGETQATIIVRDAAKKFVVTGSYEAACVFDLSPVQLPAFLQNVI